MKLISTNYIICLFLLISSFNQADSKETIASDTVTIGNVEYSIADLMLDAKYRYHKQQEDAIVLCSYNSIDISNDFTIKRKIHKLVWVSTHYALRNYADHKIIYNSRHEEFTVDILRTWRDNQWWVTGESGIVETLPGALRNSPDYATFREMVLMHDGIELPCILEYSYTIEDVNPFWDGHAGLEFFQDIDPTLISRIEFTYPLRKKINFEYSAAVPEPVKSITEPQSPDKNKKPPLNREVLSFQMKNLKAEPFPRTSDPAIYKPHFTWSTWKSWSKLGKDFRKVFNNGLEINSELSDSLDILLLNAMTISEKAHLVSDFVENSTRYVNAPSGNPSYSVRSVNRIWNCSYGNLYERALLAAACFTHAGFEVFPTFRSEGFHDVNEGIACLSRLPSFGIWVSGKDEVEAFYNPENSRLYNGLSPIFGRTIWIPGSGDDPKVNWSGESNLSRMEITLDLEFDFENNKIAGKGVFRVTQGFNTFDKMEGLESPSEEFFEEVVSSIIENSKLTSYNFTSFSRFLISAGFQFEANLEQVDEESTLMEFRINEPSGGIISRLPGDIHLYSESRTSPAYLPGKMDQVLTIRLNNNNSEVVYLPPDFLYNCDNGSLEINTKTENNRTILTKKLSINKLTCQRDNWQYLRKLFLTNTNKNYQIIKIKNGTE